LRVEELAALATMSVSSFHRHFRDVQRAVGAAAVVVLLRDTGPPWVRVAGHMELRMTVTTPITTPFNWEATAAEVVAGSICAAAA
jgi:hypothetical protein